MPMSEWMLMVIKKCLCESFVLFVSFVVNLILFCCYQADKTQP